MHWNWVSRWHTERSSYENLFPSEEINFYLWEISKKKSSSWPEGKTKHMEHSFPSWNVFLKTRRFKYFPSNPPLVSFIFAIQRSQVKSVCLRQVEASFILSTIRHRVRAPRRWKAIKTNTNSESQWLPSHLLNVGRSSSTRCSRVFPLRIFGSDSSSALQF